MVACLTLILRMRYGCVSISVEISNIQTYINKWALLVIRCWFLA